MGGLRMLARMRAWSKVRDLAKHMLESEEPGAMVRGGGQDPKTDDAWLCYFFAVLKLGRPPYTDLHRALASFLSNAETVGRSRYEKVMLTLRLLQIELEQFSEASALAEVRQAAQQTCIDRLGDLQRRLAELAEPSAEPSAASAVLPPAEALLWWRRVTMSLVNASVRTGNWRTALIMLEELRVRNKPPSVAATSAPANSMSPPPVTFAYDMEILSRIGRVFLQMGNLDEAATFFGRAAKIDAARRKQETAVAVGTVPPADTGPCARIQLNAGLLAFARNDFRTSLSLLQNVITAERTRQDTSQLTFDGAAKDFVSSTLFCGVDVEEDLLVRFTWDLKSPIASRHSISPPSFPRLPPPLSLSLSLSLCVCVRLPLFA